MKLASPFISLVVPMYNEGAGLEVFFSRTVPVLEAITADWEILCVNDGSTDETSALLKARHVQDARVKMLSLSRNFGKEAALTAGLEHAFGQVVIPMDADLQDPPELVADMVAKWREGYKVVLATRRNRSGEGAFKRFSAWAFYRLMRRVLSISLPENTGDFRLMDQQVVQALRLLPERTRFMKGLFAWAGFKTAQLYFDRPGRAEGMAKQNYSRLWQLAKDGIFSFTTLPLRITTYLGVIISTAAFLYAGWLIVRTVLWGVDVPGYASIMAAVLCMGGIQLISMGIIGEYLGRIYRETKQRPIYLIEETAGITANQQD